MNDVRSILGVITVEVVATNNKSMTVKMNPTNVFDGTVGPPPNMASTTEGQTFLEKWEPMTIKLIN